MEHGNPSSRSDQPNKVINFFLAALNRGFLFQKHP